MMVPPVSVRLALAVCCLVVAGCTMPYSYCCDDSCGYAAISGRHSGPDCGPCGGTMDPGVACGCEADCLPGACVCGGCGVGPLRALKGLLACAVCNAGCGRVYWGEWSYDPPDACDPCNNHGDYIGPRACGPRGWCKFWLGLHGQRWNCGNWDCGSCCGDACCGWSGDCCGEMGAGMEMQMYDGQQPTDMPGTSDVWDDFPLDESTPVQTADQPYYKRAPRSVLRR